METIDILMATYNGAQFIEAQIYSIIFQSYKNWKLIIHDDGSSDNTVEIIKSLSKKDNRIILIEDNIKCGGAAQNFLHLLNFSHSPFCMFCDQDDIWFDNKIQLMYDNIKKFKTLQPIVIYCNSYVWKPNLGILGLSSLTMPDNIENILFHNSGIQGCCSMFNSLAKKMMLKWEGEISMHDHLLNLIAIIIGEVYNLNIPLQLYRQHETNVTGETDTKLLNFNRIFSKIPVLDSKHFNTIKMFTKIYKDEIPQSNYQTLQIFLDLENSNKFKRLIKIIENKFAVHNSTIFLIIKTILRKYIQ